MKSMIEAKFRFWAPDKRMIDDHAGWVADIGINEALKESREYGYVPMQFTGRKDKNGKEVYVGDIFGNPEQLGCVVEQQEDGAYILRFIHPLMKNKKISILDDKVRKSRIIGNIYENPELLK